MDLGTGIFLSSALLAIVLLYGFTKDRWRWRKIILRMLVISFILFAGTAGVLILANYWEELFPVQVGRQTQYAGLKLGMNPQEVMYIKGYPPAVLEEDLDPKAKGFLKETKTKELGEKKTTDFKHWAYDEYKTFLIIEFNNERTAVVSIRCYSEDKSSRCPPVGGVKDGTSENDALRKLDSQAEQRIDGVTKRLRFPGLGVTVWLEKEMVYMLEVYDPQAR